MNSTERFLTDAAARIINNINWHMGDGLSYNEARQIAKPRTLAGPRVWAMVDSHFAANDEGQTAPSGVMAA